jgi:hypothetical protein
MVGVVLPEVHGPDVEATVKAGGRHGDVVTPEGVGNIAYRLMGTASGRGACKKNMN